MTGKLLLLVFVTVLSSSMSSLPTAQAVPAMFVFGDSTADVGNNNYLPGDKAKANHPYYGIDFTNSVATGRFSNGFNGADYLAMELGFKESPPPVLSIKRPQQVFRGVNFASGGSGIFDTTGKNVSISMSTQIVHFKKVVNIFLHTLGKQTTAFVTSKSIFLFSTANNDMFEYFFNRFRARNSSLDEQLVCELVNKFRDQLQQIYKLGARKFVVTGTGPLGCIPGLRAATPNEDCVKELNDLSQAYNKATLAMLQDLSSTLKGMKYSFTQSYRFSSKALASPKSFGYTEIKAACCGSGRLNAAGDCNVNATVCSDRSKYLFWDNVHPTQATYQFAALGAFKGSKEFATPINVRQLVKS